MDKNIYAAIAWHSMSLKAIMYTTMNLAKSRLSHTIRYGMPSSCH